MMKKNVSPIEGTTRDQIVSTTEFLGKGLILLIQQVLE